MIVPSQHPGLPPAEELKSLRIWDSYFTPSFSHPGIDGFSRLEADIERSLPAIRIGQFEKLCLFPHVGIGTTADAQVEELLRSNPAEVGRVFERWPNLFLGMIQLNANDVAASKEAIKRWIVDGPMIGVYFPGGGPAALACIHENVSQLLPHLIDANAVIMQHTWFRTGGKQSPGSSTPAELAELARRFPEQHFICAHAGGEWEKGILAVRPHKNISIETSGFDATAGFLEMAVRELGSRRIIFGSHLPSRSLGTELGKVLGAGLSEEDSYNILGDNLRLLIAD